MNKVIKYTKILLIPIIILSVIISFIIGTLQFVWPGIIYFAITAFLFIKMTDWD